MNSQWDDSHFKSLKLSIVADMAPFGVQYSNSANMGITGGNPGEKVRIILEWIHPKKEDQERDLGLFFSFGLKRNHDSGGNCKLSLALLKY